MKGESTAAYWEAVESGDFGRVMEQTRHGWEWSRQELGEYLSVDAGTVRLWEIGKVLPYRALHKKISEWLSADKPIQSVALNDAPVLIMEVRLRRHMSTRDVADQIGVQPRTVRDWERGALTPNLNNLKRLRKWLEEEPSQSPSSVSEVVSDEEPSQPLSSLSEVSRGKIGSYIREKRIERDMTQTQLAARLGVSRETFSKWERGEQVPSLQNLPRIAEWLDEEFKVRHRVRMDEIDGARIRDERLRRDLTEQELADHLGCHVTAVVRWESGMSEPRPDNFKKLQEWFDNYMPIHLIKIEEVGDNIKNERERRGMSKWKVAEHFGVLAGTIDSWERGIATPAPSHLRLLREWLGETIREYRIGFDPVGHRIKKERLRRGMSQGDLARHFGIHYPTLSAWELGKSTPRPHYLRMIRKWFEDDVPKYEFNIEGFGERIRAERRRSGMTQVDLADYLGISESIVRRTELGISIPKPAIIRKFREWVEEDTESWRT